MKLVKQDGGNHSLLVFCKERCMRQIESLAHFNTVSCLAHYLCHRSPVTRITPLSFITPSCNTVYSSLISFPYENHYSLPPFHASPVQPCSLCFFAPSPAFYPLCHPPLVVLHPCPCCHLPTSPTSSALPPRHPPRLSPSPSPCIPPALFFNFLWPRPFSLFLQPSLSISLCFLLRTRR